MKNLIVLNYKNNVLFKMKSILEEIKLKDVIKYFETNNIAVKLNDYAYIEVQNEKLNIFNLKGSQKLLYMKIDKNEDIEKTELFKTDLEHEKKSRGLNDTELKKFVGALCLEAVIGFTYSYYVLNKIQYPNIRKIKGFKIVECANYTRITDSTIMVESKLYKEIDEHYSYKATTVNAKIIDNTLLKKEVVIPSKLYPLPNSSKLSVFAENNTEDLNDKELNALLTGKLFKPGHCYFNTDEIIKLIKDSKLDYKIDYYAGWMLFAGHLTHHAWVVLNDKHIIDSSILKKQTELKKEHILSEYGLVNTITHEEISTRLAEMVKEDVSFKEKYVFGKVLSEYIYIGVKSNPTEARISFNTLLDNEPLHPDYLNIDRTTGYNKTLKMIHSQL